uniref:Guanylate cyclase activator 2B n=1 Tax=Seriola lalandi dorsalis TaxID=1841481 RepID=A0A3B4YQM7_SERLL
MSEELSTMVKICKPGPHTFVLFHYLNKGTLANWAFSWVSLFQYKHLPLLPGKWIVFLTGGRQEAPGADRQRFAPGQQNPRFRVSTLSLCADPMLPQEFLLLCRQRGASASLTRLAAVPLDVCEICAFAACTGC